MSNQREFFAINQQALGTVLRPNFSEAFLLQPGGGTGDSFISFLSFFFFFLFSFLFLGYDLNFDLF